MTAIGWLGSLCFAICGAPQALRSIRDGHSDGLSWGFLLLWFFGELFTLIYVLGHLDYPLLANYTCNLVCLSVVLKYKLRPRPELHTIPLR